MLFERKFLEVLRLADQTRLDPLPDRLVPAATAATWSGWIAEDGSGALTAEGREVLRRLEARESS